MKRYLAAAILATLVCFGASPASGSTPASCSLANLEISTVTVTRVTDCSGAISIPDEIEVIAGGSFAYTEHITSVSFGVNSKLETIGMSAFEGSALASITIPKSVTLIDDLAFAGTSQLSTITFESGSKLNEIGLQAFFLSGITSITIPASVETIGTYAFESTSSLSTVNFATGSSLTQISAGVFSGSGVSSIDIPGGVNSIGIAAFASTSSLTTVRFDPSSTPLLIGNFAFSSSAIRSFTLPARATSIGTQAFQYTESLTDFNFAPGSKLTSIGGGAFLESGLTSITIPASVTTIAFGAFEQMSDIETADFSAATGLEEIPPYFFHYSSLQSVKLPRGLKRIGFSAFYNNLLTEVTIPASVTEIGNDAFGANRSLTTVRFLGRTAPATVGTDVFSNSVARAIVPAGSTSYGPDGSLWNNLTVSIEPSTGGSGALVVPPPAEVMEKVTSLKLSSPSLGKPQKVKIREIVSEVGKKASYTIRAGINKVPGLSKKQEKALARSRAKAIREYLIKHGVKKSKIKISVKLFDSGEEARTRLIGKRK